MLLFCSFSEGPDSTSLPATTSPYIGTECSWLVSFITCQLDLQAAQDCSLAHQGEEDQDTLVNRFKEYSILNLYNIYIFTVSKLNMSRTSLISKEFSAS